MEGPSLIILKEELAKFKGKKILSPSGNSKTVEILRLQNRSVTDFSSWGKHFFICFRNSFLKVHFLMFGSYSIDKPKDRESRLQLGFKNGTLFLYSCSVREMEGRPADYYDWRTDLMSDEWSLRFVTGRIRKSAMKKVADVLLDQDIFTGSGNIIKNEVLYRLRLHPDTRVESLSPVMIRKLASEARKYSFEFYEWKKVYQLRKNWKAYKKRKCLQCGSVIISKITGALKRRSYFCPFCQRLPR